MANLNRYVQLIERIFAIRFKKGAGEVEFEREDIERVAKELKIKLPKNLGDLIYTFRYRVELPESIRTCCPKGKSWVIRPAGRSRYKFVAISTPVVIPNAILAETKIPNATPGIIELYALSDEQALLAKLRYNRLIDIFTGVTCYSLQNHLRTTVPMMGQVETDEIYIGVDRKGSHYIFPVQTKGGRDKINIVQIEQDFALCAAKFPALICQPIAAQFMGDDLIALFAFEERKTKEQLQVAIVMEKHYRLVLPEHLSAEDLANYRERPID